MSFDPVSAGFDLVKTAVNKIWPDKTEQEKQELANAFALVNGQLEINKVEAASPSLFVSGWRPAVGWVCTIGLAMQFMIAPLITWGTIVVNHPVVLPPLDMAVLITMLGGLLGIGGLRTFEKVNSVDRK